MERDPLIEACAKAAHEANRIYCEAIGDNSQKRWEDAGEEFQDSSRIGAAFALEGHSPKEQHEKWCASRVAAGWTYGEAKDVDKKTHPCLVPYESLPLQQRQKDALYIGVVLAMRDALAKPDAVLSSAA